MRYGVEVQGFTGAFCLVRTWATDREAYEQVLRELAGRPTDVIARTVLIEDGWPPTGWIRMASGGWRRPGSLGTDAANYHPAGSGAGEKKELR